MMIIGKILNTYLGRCPRCMRQSFLAALAFAAGTTASYAILGVQLPTLALGVTACALTLLWLAHLAVFAGRMAARAQQMPATTSSAALSRRDLGSAFVKAFAGAAAVTALPVALSGRAQAMTPCDNCQNYSGQERSDCCLCEYNNCTSGCGNDNNCVNKCLQTYNAC